MKKKFIYIAFIFPSLLFAQSLKVYDLKVEQLNNPIGLDLTQPRFSWKLESSMHNTMQTAYEILVATQPDFKDKNIVWKSKQSTDQSVYIKYNGNPLTSDTRYYWRVTIWDNHGNFILSGDKAYWHTGLFSLTDWKAKWITAADTIPSSVYSYPSPVFRKEFTLLKDVISATLYITSKGLYEAQLNGKKVGEDYLTPGWTSYKKRIQYQVYDVSSSIKKGNNAIGVTLGKGWYLGELGWVNHSGLYGKELAVIGQLMITFKDGSKQMINTDDTWRSSTGPILNSEIYHGEIYDARKEIKGWAEPGYLAQGWSSAKIQAAGVSELIGTYNEPVRKREVIKPIKYIVTPEGDHVLDFGQNMVGWVKVKAKGAAGSTISITHAEVLDKFGNFYIENLRHAKQANIYTLSGLGEEVFEPHFTFQGFRYIKIEGYPGPITLDQFEGIALYSDMKRIGTFECSNPLVNQLQHNIQWGQRGNFVDVPTDCPQRDERLGWTGDAQAFARTAAYNFGVQNFFAKWLQDLAADQNPNGGVPFVIPNALNPGAASSTGWADAATIIPWNMYEIYGDTAILARQYPSMKMWVKYMVDSSVNNLWNRGFHFGDWLFFSMADDRDGKSAVTDKYLIAQCFYAHSVQLMKQTAQVLGLPQDVAYYNTLLNNVKAAFNKEYVTGSGRMISNTQTAYVLALNFDMLPEIYRQEAANRLAQNIKSYNYHITTGFLGTPYICHVLSRFGYSDVAYKLLLQDTYPSWLYPVKMGATTIWERWDGIKPDSTFQTASMNSFNHYAYGAIGDWMYRVVCGIEIAAPGYKKSIIAPVLTDQLTYAKSSTVTPYGQILSGWERSNVTLKLNVEIPGNTESTIVFPIGDSDQVLFNGQSLKSQSQFKILANNPLKISVGSGKYLFEITK